MAHATLTSPSIAQRLAALHDQHHAPMANLMLAVYAADAARVLALLARHADTAPPFAATLSAICPDWRNPGSTALPHDLIAANLTQAMADLQVIFQGLEQVIHTARSEHEPR